jgi:Class II flagellar assembly regulator
LLSAIGDIVGDGKGSGEPLFRAPMKVNGTGAVRNVAGSRRVERSGGGGDFARHLDVDEREAAGQIAGTASIAGLESILSLQEVDEPPERRRRAVARGASLLDRLDALRLALLDGTLSRSTLESLASVIRANRQDVGDPQLQMVLDEIELRAAVELAKYEVAGR